MTLFVVNYYSMKYKLLHHHHHPKKPDRGGHLGIKFDILLLDVKHQLEEKCPKIGMDADHKQFGLKKLLLVLQPESIQYLLCDKFYCDLGLTFCSLLD